MKALKSAELVDISSIRTQERRDVPGFSGWSEKARTVKPWANYGASDEVVAPAGRCLVDVQRIQLDLAQELAEALRNRGSSNEADRVLELAGGRGDLSWVRMFLYTVSQPPSVAGTISRRSN